MTRGDKTVFFFDLDGVITAEESLAAVDRSLELGGQLAEATHRDCATALTPRGYEESFSRRLAMLSAYPVSLISSIISEIELHDDVVEFIRAHAGSCVILSSNLGCFCSGLAERIGCRAYFSGHGVADDRLCAPLTLLDKESVIRSYRDSGAMTVMTGDGSNDIAAMRAADISIAAAYAPAPSPDAIRAAGFIASDTGSLIGRLDSIFRART